MTLTEAAAARIDAARPAAPVEFSDEPPPTYPVEALTGLLGECASVMAQKGQLSPAITGQSVLAVAALLAQQTATVRAHSVKPLSEFFMTVAASGEGKSTADDIATASIREAEGVDFVAFQQAINDWLAAPKADRDERPINPARLITDFTQEGLTRQFREGLTSLGAFNAEAGSVLGGHSFSADKKLATAAGLSGLFDGSGIRGRARASDDRGGLEFLPEARLSAHWLLQPEAASGTLNDPLLQEQGLLPRTLLAIPQPTPPRRYEAFFPNDHQPIRDFHARVTELVRQPVLISGSRPCLQFAPDAEKVLARFFEAVEKTAKGRNGKHAQVRPWAIRATEHVCRVAGVMHVFNHGPNGEIGIDSTAGALALVNYSLDCWMYVLERKPLIEAREYSNRLFKWLSDQPGGQANGRAILRGGPKPRSANLRDAALSLLEGQHRVQQIGHEKWGVIHG